MTYYTAAFAGYFIASFVLGILWVLLFFKQRYQDSAGDFALPNPIFALGFSGITLFGIVVIVAFDFAYPVLGPGYGAAFLILLVMWAPHYVCNIGTAAKYQFADRREWLMLKAGFNILNVVVLAGVMMFAYENLK